MQILKEIVDEAVKRHRRKNAADAPLPDWVKSIPANAGRHSRVDVPDTEEAETFLGLQRISKIEGLKTGSASGAFVDDIGSLLPGVADDHHHDKPTSDADAAAADAAMQAFLAAAENRGR